jgi:TonB family protein
MLGVEVAKPAFGNQSAISTRGAAALRSAIQEAIQAYSQSIREVFERFSMGSPDLQGDIIIGITVHPNGHILEGSLSGSSTGSAAFDQEILRNVLDWKIASFPDNRPRYVAIPFHFDPMEP